MYMPPRGGARGGKDQFEWDDVKADKHRENYLGHSVMAPVGRWQKGKDLSWYTKKSTTKDKKEELKAEIAALKKAEEEAMAAALGHKPAAQSHASLSKQEISEAFRRTSTEEKEEGAVDRIKGLGYKSRRSALMYSGTESVTTKEGATVFEHDPAVKKDHSKLEIVQTSMKPHPLPSQATPTDTPPKKKPRTENSDDAGGKRSQTKSKEKRKHKEKKRKKEKRKHRHRSSSEEERRRERGGKEERKTHRNSKRSRHDTPSASD